jgi:hypothetical protein
MSVKSFFNQALYLGRSRLFCILKSGSNLRRELPLLPEKQVDGGLTKSKGHQKSQKIDKTV